MKETYTYGPAEIQRLIQQDLYHKGKLASPYPGSCLVEGVTSFLVGQLGADHEKGQYTAEIVRVA